VNEFDPTFLSLPPSLVIDENTAVGTMILSSKPFDEDLDLNGKNQRTKTSLLVFCVDHCLVVRFLLSVILSIL
jgi:hypothetical protein